MAYGRVDDTLDGGWEGSKLVVELLQEGRDGGVLGLHVGMKGRQGIDSAFLESASLDKPGPHAMQA